MDEKELKEIFEFLQKAGANPQLCDTEVPYFEASVRAGLPTENFAEEAFVEMMSLPRKMLASTPAMILDIDGDSMEDAKRVRRQEGLSNENHKCMKMIRTWMNRSYVIQNTEYSFQKSKEKRCAK